MLADDAAQRGNRHLRHRISYIGDLDQRTRRVDDAAPDDGVDLDRHIVPGDGLLLLDRGRRGANVDSALPFDQWRQKIKPRSRSAHIASEKKHDGALILIGDAYAEKQQQQNENANSNSYGMAFGEGEKQFHDGSRLHCANASDRRHLTPAVCHFGVDVQCVRNGPQF